LNVEVSRRERFKAVIWAIALATVVVLLVPPIAEAAKAQVVKVKGNVKVVDSDGDAIESEVIPDMGLLAAEGSDGALAVRNFAGGGGFLGAGDCTDGTDPAAGNFLENFVTVSNVIVTGIIITGDGVVTVSSAALNDIPLLNFTVNNQNPNEFVGLGNGLTATAPLTFTCTNGAGGDGNAGFVILGQ
jgi:hypothetical protein